jgi:ribonuclease Z
VEAIGAPASVERPPGAPDLDVVILGAGARWPTPERGVAAAVVMRGSDHILIDCGEGTQRQMMRSVAGLRRLSVILVSHCHADHVLGLPGLLATLSESRTEPLVILGPAGIGPLVEGFRVHFGALAFPLTIREVEPGDVHPRDGYRLRAVAASHGVAALAWALEEDPLAGHLIESGLRRLGVPVGSERAALARGEEVVLAGGRRILPAQVTGPRRPGRRIVLSGDTRPAPAVEEAATGADLLVHEATFAEEERERAHETLHSTALEAARVAQDAEVGLLALTHLSNRYFGGEIEREAQTAFPDTVVPRDLDIIVVPFQERGAPELVKGGATHKHVQPAPKPEAVPTVEEAPR